jgi:hypothetical protein
MEGDLQGKKLEPHNTSLGEAKVIEADTKKAHGSEPILKRKNRF